MTVKLVVLYTQPADTEDFDQHFLGVHMPLVSKIPGLERAETARFVAAVDGEPTYYRQAELYFADSKALNAAFASDEGLAVGAHFEEIAPPGSRRFVARLDG
jgi:uncharacterized protein (TIGR02118 family)